MKTPRLALASIAILASSLLLAGCSGTSGSSGDSAGTSAAAATASPSADASASQAVPANADAVIQIGSLYEPQNLSNVDGGGQGVTEALNGNVYEGLFKLADDGSVQNLLAADHTVSEDGLTYTVTLQDGVTFHSGKPLTSADVKSSVERVVAESSQSARKSSFETITSIDTPDDKTVVFTLSEPSISFPYNLSYIWVANSDVADLKSTEDGTGPYTVGDWKHGSSLGLMRFDGYWGTPAKNSEVVFNYFTDASALNNALLTNGVDIITSIQSPDALSQFTDNPDFVINDGTSTTKELLAFNDRVKPFDSIQVRKAVYSAIDRQKLLNSIWGDYGTLIGSMVPPTDPWYEDLTGENPYDPELAKQLLTEAGLPERLHVHAGHPDLRPASCRCGIPQERAGEGRHHRRHQRDLRGRVVHQGLPEAGLPGDPPGARERPRRGLVRQPRLLLGL